MERTNSRSQWGQVAGKVKGVRIKWDSWKLPFLVPFSECMDSSLVPFENWGVGKIEVVDREDEKWKRARSDLIRKLNRFEIWKFRLVDRARIWAIIFFLNLVSILWIFLKRPNRGPLLNWYGASVDTEPVYQWTKGCLIHRLGERCVL